MKWNSVLANGYWARYAVLGAALLWLTVLALILLQQDISCPASQPFSAQTDLRRRPYPHSGPMNACGELRRHLDQLKVEVASLQEENRQLKHLAASRSFRPVEADQFLLQRAPIEEGDIEKQENTELRKVEPLVVAAERRLEGQLFSQEHEVSRRQLLNGIWELYLRLNGPAIGQKLGSADQQRLGNQFAHLLAQARSFSQQDRAEEWHKKVLDRVADRIRQTLDRLQNPRDCSQARLMLCELNKGCGFGCQLHHVSYCLLMAAAANRTMVLERDGSEWRYSDQGWKAAFLPVGKCTWAADVSSSGPPAEPFHDLGQSARIVRLPIVDGLAVRPPQLPLSFPSQFADLLLTHHSNPPVFFIAQFLAFLMRENKQTSEFVQRAEKQIPFELGPVVGLQIRRTDKVGTEAAYHSVEEYFRWADLWFHVEQIRLGIPLLARRAFIATDDPAVIDEARQKYGSKGWIIFGNDETAEAAQPGSRYSDRSLLGVIADVRLLSRCSYIVCTFSSQVCRMGYELMQTRLGDAGDRVHSLDDIFYFGGQLAHEVEALASYQADGPDQIDLMKGDIIGIAGNHWDGWSKGTNRRTGQSGLFPSYLAREKWRIVDFPIFDN